MGRASSCSKNLTFGTRSISDKLDAVVVKQKLIVVACCYSYNLFTVGMYQLLVPAPACLESCNFGQISSWICQMSMQLQCVQVIRTKTNELQLRIVITECDK